MPKGRFDTRYWEFLLGRAAGRIVPGLRRRMPFYRLTAPMIEAGTVEFFAEIQAVPFDPEDEKFIAAFVHPPPEAISRSVALVAIDDVSVLGNTGAVIDETKERLLVTRDRYLSPTYHDFRLETTRPVAKPPANYFNMVGPYRDDRNFFHFLFDWLPRLHYLLERFALGLEKLVVLTNDDLADYQRDIYRFIAAHFPDVRFEAIPRAERWRFPRLYQIDDFQSVAHTFANPGVVRFLRNLVLEGYGLKPGGGGRRLYGAGAGASEARISNENEILPYFTARGFEIVSLGRLDLRGQAALFLGAEAIAGPHGVGLAGMLFAPPGAGVLEIFASGRADDTYFLLAKSLGQRYRALVGGPQRGHEGFRADPADVEAALTKLLR